MTHDQFPNDRATGNRRFHGVRDRPGHLGHVYGNPAVHLTLEIFLDLGAALGPGGALEAFIEARQAGLVRFLGVTGHGLNIAALHRQALERFDFDAVLLPWNYVLQQNPRYAADFEAVRTICRERGVALQTIKSLARGGWGRLDLEKRRVVEVLLSRVRPTELLAGKILGIKLREGRLRQVVDVSPGRHSIWVRVRWGDDERSRTIAGTFAAGATRAPGGLSILALRSAIELGYTHFDTAENYAAGHSEELPGRQPLIVRRLLAHPHLAHPVHGRPPLIDAHRSGSTLESCTVPYQYVVQVASGLAGRRHSDLNDCRGGT